MRKLLLANSGVHHAKRPRCLAAGMLAVALSPALAYAAEPAKTEVDNKEAARTLAPVKVIGTQGERIQGYKADTSRLGKIKQGQRVAQGTVIGYVGTTGLSTGPHLHYEFRINNIHKDPLTVRLPESLPLNGNTLASFRQQIAPLSARLTQAQESRMASID